VAGLARVIPSAYGLHDGADLNPDDTLPWVNDPEADQHRRGASALS